MFYVVQSGDSPAIIAQRFGVSTAALIAANPSKPTTEVSDPNGRAVRTWRSLVPGETVSVPTSGAVGDALTTALSALAGINPCDSRNVALVCAAQQALGLKADGKYGLDTATAAFRINPMSPKACSPRPTWWAPMGQSNCGSAPSLTATAAAATTAAGMPDVVNPCDPRNVALVCDAQRKLGLVVDGKYGPGTAAALQKIVPGAPPACSPRPTWWAPAGQSNCGGALVPTAPAAPTSTATTPAAAVPLVPGAVSALIGINPCLKSNVALICAAQKALGLVVDGKYGPNTAAAARRIAPKAPPACSPQPAWWAPAGKSNCGGAIVPPSPAPVPTAPAPVAAPQAVRALIGIDPCDARNVALVCAAQRALKLTVDGKYGPKTAAAAKRTNATAPAACGAQRWWAPAGKSNCGRATSTATATAPTTAPSASASTTIQPALAPAPLPSPITPPEQKKVSTGAIVAGSVGAAALVGTLALAVSKYKPKRKP